MGLPRNSPPVAYSEVRPWGGFEKFMENEQATVKRIWVNPGMRLSLQSHKHRSELWVILEGTLEVEVDGTTTLLEKGDRVFIPCGARHRASGRQGYCEWLEIAFGDFAEDDIERFEDDHGRV